MAENLTQGRALRSPGAKIFMVAALTVAMAVPLFFIQLALSDRESTAAAASTDVAAGWGGPQVVAGPVLTVPYTIERSQVIDGKTVQTTVRDTRMLLPETLDLAVRASAQTRHRGIFAVPVYRSQVHMQAQFDRAALAALLPPDAKPLWNEASVGIVVSDSHGLADNVTLSVNGQARPFLPGHGIASEDRVLNDGSKVSGIHVPLALAGPDDLKLETDFVLRGSRELSVSPLGRRTVASIESDWASPSFFGAFLPTERKLGADGFKASWTVPYLARGFGQTLDNMPAAMQTIISPAFGVRFYQPVDYYQLVQRALKYAILFVALSFLVFFVVETLSVQRLHFVQYLLVGMSQVLFYLLLLSLCEHIGFALSYLIASAATVAATGLYASAVLASRYRAAILAAILAALYALMYVILNAEDYALLIGSLVLFAALGATMYVTRRIDWYRLQEEVA
jgi:inner membrane protein